MGGPLRLDGGGPNPVITITTPGDSTQARTAGTLSVSVTDGVGGSSITPDSVAWTATDPHGGDAAAALDDDTAASTTYDETAADRISGTHRVSCVVTIGGQAYPAVEASWTVGRYKHGFWQVPVFWGDSSTWPTHDVQSGGAGNYDFDDCGLAGATVTLALDPDTSTTYSIGSGGITVDGDFIGTTMPLTTLYAGWVEGVRWVAEMGLAADTYASSELCDIRGQDSDSSDQETVGVRDATGTVRFASTRVASSWTYTNGSAPTLPGVAALVYEAPNEWAKYYDNGASVPSSPTLLARRSRNRDDSGSANALVPAKINFVLGSATESKTATFIYVWMDI